ncbi:MAG: DUF58 domain-containing protein [Oscillospiraceae bacterium]|nr:DUF58 domain-containing protein [Oscillospiraceae bacterium]
MLVRRLLYAMVLLCALLGQLLDVGYLFHFIFYAVLCFPLLGLAVSLPAMLGCRAALEATAPQIRRGEKVSMTLRLDNRFHLPIARASYRLRVTNRMTGQEHLAKAVMRGLTPEEDRLWTLETDHCGAIECRVERLWVCDCLGLFALPVRRPRLFTLLVAPIAEETGPIELPEGVGAPVPELKNRTVFGEVYELRDYRPGDSMRMIHWKMSAKRDELITREPPEDTRPLPVLTFDHFGPLAQVDRTLDRLEGTSMALLAQERPHEIRWAHPETGVVRVCAVAGERDWAVCLAAILADPAPLQGRSIREHALRQGSGAPIYQIHVTGKEEANGEP